MARRMVVLPFEMAKSILEPMKGHTIFDLKEGADDETRDRLNRALNRQDGEDKPAEKRKLVEETPEATAPSPQTPVVPAVKKKALKEDKTRQQLRARLLKTGAFDNREKTVFNWQGGKIDRSNIDDIMNHLYGPTNHSHPPGTREVAARLRVMNQKDFPNKAVVRLIQGNVSPVETPRSRRWTRF